GNATSILSDIELSHISGTVAGDCPMELRFVRNLKLDRCDLTAVTGEIQSLTREAGPSWETKF
ncbi:MAG: hypothetical protein IJT50_03415, partial [Lentisphaeria bacterium]|nr:hypothetical protein [Lentisphaeria bacterium]